MKIRCIILLAMFCTMAACFPWGPRAKNYLPEVTALEKNYGYDGEVIIVGAGAAGLAAARVLEDNNVSYTILEATERHGGRLGESTNFADFPIALGAEWIHNNAEILDVLSGVEGTANSMELIPYELKSAMRWDGEEITSVSRWELKAMFAFFPEYKFKTSTWYDFVQTHYGLHVQNNIRYESPVSSINYGGRRVELETTDGRRFVADKVIVTVPIGVLQRGAIQFTPPLSENQQAALDEVRFFRGFKLFLKFSENFYPDAIECEGGGGGKAFWDVAFGKETDDNVLGLLVTGPLVETYYSLGSNEAIVSEVIAELDLMFDGSASRTYTEEFLLMDWGRHPYTHGTWVEGFRIEASTLANLNESLNQKIYFAGEAHDIRRQLGVPGAILSGFDSVDRLLTGQD